MIGQNEKILLMNRDSSYIVTKSQKKFSCNDGLISLDKIREFGQEVKTNKGVKYFALRPSFTDLLRKCRRMPQIIMPKDAAQIIAFTGLKAGWNCFEAGAGSGFLSVFLGSVVSPGGHVTSYEKKKEFFENVKRNIEYCGLENVVSVKNLDATKGIKEKSLDLVVLDMIDAEKVVKHASRSLRPGGWLVVYSPHIEQQKKVVDNMKKDFFSIRTVENIQRSWQVNEFTHPHPSQVVHTGFMTFARNLK